MFYDWASATTDPNPLVFMAAKDNATTVELYVTSDNGQTTTKLSGSNGFRGQRHGLRYITQRAICGLSGGPGDQGYVRAVYRSYRWGHGYQRFTEVRHHSGGQRFCLGTEHFTEQSQIAFRAFNPFTGNTGGNIELFTNFSSGGIPVTVSNSPSVGVNVDTFKWSPTSQLIAYTANIIVGSRQQFELFAADPKLINLAFQISNIPAATNAYTIGEFQWSPNGSIIAFLADIRYSGSQ